MKLFRLIISVLLVLLLSSCSKTDTLPLCGKWVLVSGNLYVETPATYAKEKYSHFGPNKTRSQLSGFNKPSFEFEKLIKDTTTWEFRKNGDFILNGDEDRPLFVNVTASNLTIIEHPTSGISMLGGSARPISCSTYDYDNKIMSVIVQEQWGSYNGYNMVWYSELFFRLVE